MTLPDALLVPAQTSGSGVEPLGGAEPAPVFRQLRLFAAENPMQARFPRAFMQTVPREPGVYYFRDAEGRLLYVGQSHELRKRVGSYRHIHPDRHPRRLVRLVHQVRQIEWEVCVTPEAAIERERELLLELRPGFNRAGVWKPPPWWLRVAMAEGAGGAASVFCLELRREAELEAVESSSRDSWLDGGAVNPVSCAMPPQLLGPFPASFRWVYASLVRCLHGWLFPEVRFHALPSGLMGEKVPRTLQWSLASVPSAEAAMAVQRLVRWLSNPRNEPGEEGVAASNTASTDWLLELFNRLPEGAQPVEREFWLGQLEVLARFAGNAVLLDTLLPQAKGEK